MYHFHISNLSSSLLYVFGQQTPFRIVYYTTILSEPIHHLDYSTFISVAMTNDSISMIFNGRTGREHGFTDHRSLLIFIRFLIVCLVSPPELWYIYCETGSLLVVASLLDSLFASTRAMSDICLVRNQPSSTSLCDNFSTENTLSLRVSLTVSPWL